MPFLAGGGYGLLLRALFAGWIVPGFKLPDAMSFSFIFGVPVVVGAITIYLAELKSRRGWGYYFFAPWASVAVFVGGTAIPLIEGLICIALGMPVFLLGGSMGGLLMGLSFRIAAPRARTIQGLAVLPLLLGLAEAQLALPERYTEIRKTQFIAAPAGVIWDHINDAASIRPEELGHAWAYRIGVPLPIEGRTIETPEGRVRKSVWEKGVHFDEVITDWRPGEYLRWTYRFAPDSVPAGALDEHVNIGGRYFDLLDTSYTLSPAPGGTNVTVSLRYRVSTQFNWYADAAGRFLIEDCAEAILGLYKRRSEGTVRQSARG